MTIDQIRQQLAEKISAASEWVDALSDTEPGHYGVEEWDVTLSYEDIWVDVPQKKFSFKNAHFDFELLLGSSNHDDGTTMSFQKIAKGQGEFEFSSKGKDVEIENMQLEFDMDLFDDEK